MPSHACTAADAENYGLKKGKHVKQAYVTYTRNGVCVTTTGNRVYTDAAQSKSSGSVYSTTAHAWDDLRWGDKYTTKFNYSFCSYFK